MKSIILMSIGVLLYVFGVCPTAGQISSTKCSSQFNAEQVSSVSLNESHCRSGSFTTPVNGIIVVNGKMSSIKVWQKGKEEFILIPGQSAQFPTTGEVNWRTID